ncbi:DNA-binding PadR family transcriptional regulator [Kitasatospora gansuensis]|uniref:DNA-binding PadR family transcriptional regulator n=1 Tax=Kitasatospora gansuensis TaxID=258050 RepID=A0A7W7S9B9_9ACTN|nr:PadR family transcriptional regulator [Kitasatospora gansuensis]MBB4946067.1 DNA-binding PadR family transcriptional regulator [Kitasatospora gansuensis]
MTERQLQEPTRLVLTALADAPRHGYAIIQEVLAISGGQSRLSTGTLYTALDRLLQQGLVRIESEQVVSGRLRRTFALTGQGQDLLAEEAGRLRTAAAEVERRLAAARLRLNGATG